MKRLNELAVLKGAPALPNDESYGVDENGVIIATNGLPVEVV